LNYCAKNRYLNVADARQIVVEMLFHIYYILRPAI
jgi:hypothetical protein